MLKIDIKGKRITPKIEAEKILEKQSNKFTLIMDFILCSEKLLTPHEKLLWVAIRKRVKNKDRNGYYKEPAIDTGESLYAKMIGVSIRALRNALLGLAKKGLIKVERARGKKNKIWLINLEEFVEKEKDNKLIYTGRIRSIVALNPLDQKIVAEKLFEYIKGKKVEDKTKK